MSEVPEKQAKVVEEEEEEISEDEGLPEYARAGAKPTKAQIEERRKLEEELKEITVSELTEKEKDELLSTDDKYMMSMILETGEHGGAGPDFTDLDFTSSITKEEKNSKFSKFTKTLLAREFEINRQRMNALVSKRERFITLSLGGLYPVSESRKNYGSEVEAANLRSFRRI